MSDYLQNLLTRSLNPSRVVQPRLASFFEPRSDAASQASAPFAFVTEEGATPSTDTTHEARPERRREDAPPRVFNPPRHEAAPLTSQPPPADITSRPETLPVAPRPPAPHAHEAAPHAALQTPREPTPPRLSEEKGTADAREEHDRRAVEPKRDAPAPGRTDDSRATRVSEPRVAPGQASRVIAPRVVPAPSAPPSRPPQFAETNDRAISDAAPTIRVTIGRVDVRAVTSPPQEKRRAPEPRRPALTLEDYLRRRGGGGR